MFRIIQSQLYLKYVMSNNDIDTEILTKNIFSNTQFDLIFSRKYEELLQLCKSYHQDKCILNFIYLIKSNQRHLEMCTCKEKRIMNLEMFREDMHICDAYFQLILNKFSLAQDIPVEIFSKIDIATMAERCVEQGS